MRIKNLLDGKYKEKIRNLKFTNTIIKEQDKIKNKISYKDKFKEKGFKLITENPFNFSKTFGEFNFKADYEKGNENNYKEKISSKERISKEKEKILFS